jgi:hypothetical protein
LILFLIAASSFEWAQIAIGSDIKPAGDPDSILYHVSLLKAEI